MEINRRDFIRLFGGVSGGVALGALGCNEIFDVPEALIDIARNGPGIETWKNSICSLCPGGCGIRVRLIDSVPVYVRGNPIYPVNQGGMCSLGLNSLHALYNPDRLKGPIKRVEHSGSGKWQSISWDEGLGAISETLVKLRNEGKAHQVAFLGSDERGLMRDHIAQFMKAYGSPNYYQFSSTQNDAVPYSLLHGHSQIPAYDFANAKLIVSFGANFLEEGYSPIYYTKLYSHHQERQTRYIQIESRMSLTASNADRWIPIQPGTYGALALGVAYILIREELYDAQFIKEHSFGFDDWIDPLGGKHTGFKSLVLKNYYPERVSEITGIPSKTILELGRELGNTKQSLVIGGKGTLDNTNGTYTQMAVHSLNALLGNFEKEGGTFFVDESPFVKLPQYHEDAIAKQGNKQASVAHSSEGVFPLAKFSIESFAKNILADHPYPISLLFLYKGNPLFQTLNHRDFESVLKKIPLVVSFDSIINETSEHAHFVFPEHTFLETWNEISNVPSVGFTHVGIQQPIVAPLYDTRHCGDVLIDIAKRIGGTVSSSFPFANYQEELRHTIKGVYDSGEGAIVTEGMKRLWLEYLQQRGWQSGRYSSYEEFWVELLDQGGWWNPIRKPKSWKQIFQTPSGKFEFYSQKLKSVIDSLIEKKRGKGLSKDLDTVLNALHISARGDEVLLPHYEAVSIQPKADEPLAHKDGFPLFLITFQVMANRNGEGSSLPMMQEMFGYMVKEYWRTWVEIHPETAAKHGISDGMVVWVESSLGSVKVTAKLLPGIMPNVVAIPFGLGHTSFGRYAKNVGVNPNSILLNQYDTINGKPATEATKVKISVVV